VLTRLWEWAKKQGVEEPKQPAAPFPDVFVAPLLRVRVVPLPKASILKLHAKRLRVRVPQFLAHKAKKAGCGRGCRQQQWLRCGQHPGGLPVGLSGPVSTANYVHRDKPAQ
jgi:hypothetical protein